VLLVVLSTKAAPLDVVLVHGEAVELLGRSGLRAIGEQEPKTRRGTSLPAHRRATSERRG
jgi:hypothetical protein